MASAAIPAAPVLRILRSRHSRRPVRAADSSHRRTGSRSNWVRPAGRDAEIATAAHRPAPRKRDDGDHLGRRGGPGIRSVGSALGDSHLYVWRTGIFTKLNGQPSRPDGESGRYKPDDPSSNAYRSMLRSAIMGRDMTLIDRPIKTASSAGDISCLPPTA